MLIVPAYRIGELRSKFCNEYRNYFILDKSDQTLIEVAFPNFFLSCFKIASDKRHCLSESFVREVVGNVFIYLVLYAIETKILINYEAPKIFKYT